MSSTPVSKSSPITVHTMLLFSIRWDQDGQPQQKKFPLPFKRPHSFRENFVSVRVTCLDAAGRVHVFVKQYEQWIGVCTSRIDRVLSTFSTSFPGAKFHHKLLMTNCKKVLPYFGDRLKTGKLDYVSKPFYKVYATGASVHDVGRFFSHKYKVAYYEKTDWSCRLYLDMCCSQQSSLSGFLYKWYEVDDSKSGLLDAFHMVPDRVDPPMWSIAAFDLETVPMDGEERVPTGVHPTDRIVMISLVKWKLNKDGSMKRYLLYLDPTADDSSSAQPFHLEDVKVLRYTKESKLLHDFHLLVSKSQVLTGYNIDGFDLPCLFARLLWLGMSSQLSMYRSFQIGDTVVTTIQDKLVVDLYAYFRTFSSHDLPGFKLDDVAKIKLLDMHKVPIKATGIHAWYSTSAVKNLLHSEDVRECHSALQPRHVEEHQFGTFREYLVYCMRDSDLVYRLFQKENVLLFLVERSNFTTLNIHYALHVGNSKFIMEAFKTTGTVQGYFINMKFFVCNTDVASNKYRDMFVDDGRTYQGALNYCLEKQMFKNVAVEDFNSMYPSVANSSNLCYGTCDILTAQELAALPPHLLQQLVVYPYRNHSEKDFTDPSACWLTDDKFKYPEFDPSKDKFAIVINPNASAFLPHVIRTFLAQRKHHQAEWKKTGLVIHDNAQRNIKILINSLYGVMANKDSPLGYLQIGISIVTLARYQLLGSYHYLKRLGYTACYADTDSLMVPNWPHDDCKQVNDFLALPGVELKFEQRMKKLLVLSKKRYVYVKEDDSVVTKGFQKKVNELVRFMSDKILRHTLDRYDGSTEVDPSDGWIAWVETLIQAYYMCRDPKKFTITRKAKMLKDYKSKTCATYRMLQKHPEKENSFLEYAFSRADVAANCRSQWIMDVEQVEYVDFEQLFMSQKKIFVDLLNVAFWNLPNPLSLCDMVLNTMRWKSFVHAELLHRFATGKKQVTLFVERGIKYTFKINDHLHGRRTGRLVREVVDEASAGIKRRRLDGAKVVQTKRKKRKDE